MVLHLLEFSECFLDSPWFRQSIKEHEDELERTNTQIKLLIKDAKAMLLACRKQGEMLQAFSERLKKFKFEIIGDNLTDAEKGIAGSLKEFGSMLEEIECEWTRTIERSELQLIEPLEKFRKDHIHSSREAKKSFDKSSDRYYKQMEQTLGLSHKKKDHQLLDSDTELTQQKKNFHKVSLNYVYKLQEVQERKKFEFVEHLLMFMQVYFNFFHQTHETAIDCKEYMNDIQMRLVNTRSQYEGARDKTQRLMRKMMDDPSSSTKKNSKHHSPQRVVGQRWARAGYLYLLDKNPLGSRFTSKWTRYFCMYTKGNKLFQMLPPFSHSSSSSSSNAVTRISSINHHGSAVATVDPLIVLACTRRATDSIDKRFCFDIEVEDSAGKQSLLTLQATSQSDRKKWIAAMDGKEPSYTLIEYKKPEEFDLNETSIKFVKEIIEEIERRGVDVEGIYRLVGVSSKVDRLLQIVMDPSIRGNLNYQDDTEWELNTLTSALKNFFRNLPEPIMTFDLHADFIAAAKREDPDDRLNRVINLVAKLSADSKLVLELLIRHLKKVASKSETNKMTVLNLGVCFGPTLMRPRQETVQSIMEIKFNNIIVEILIENYTAIFGRSEEGEKEKVIGPKPVDSRPSRRFKARPRPIRRTVMRDSILEENPNELQPGQETNSRFQRYPAIRGVPAKSMSPQRKISTATHEDEEDGPSSDNYADEFGRMSPLDLNLDLDHFSSYTDLRPKTQPINPPKTQPINPPKEDSIVEQRRGRKPTPERPGGQVFRRNARSSQSERARSPPNFNLNHNNSAHPSQSVKERKEQFMHSVNAGHKRQEPRIPSINSVIKQRAFPLQDKRLDILQHNHSAKVQSPTRVVALLKEKFSPHDEENILPNVSNAKSDSSDDHSLSFLWPKPGSIKGDSYVESNSQPEARPRSTVVSSRGEVSKASTPSSMVSPTDHEKSPPGMIPVIPTENNTKGKVYIALYACQAEHSKELSFDKNAMFYDVKSSDEPGWLVGTLDGLTGLIPENYVREKIWE